MLVLGSTLRPNIYANAAACPPNIETEKNLI